MGRGKEAKHIVPKDTHSPNPAAKQTSEGFDLTKYGYKSTPKKDHLRDRVQTIVDQGYKSVVETVIAEYKNHLVDSENLVADMATEGSKQNLPQWRENPEGKQHGNPEINIAKLAVIIDFAHQMEDAGRKDELGTVFIDRQAKLGSLSLWTALQRVDDPQKIRHMHKIANKIAKEDGTVSSKKDEEKATRLEDDYLVDGRGH